MELCSTLSQPTLSYNTVLNVFNSIPDHSIVQEMDPKHFNLSKGSANVCESNWLGFEDDLPDMLLNIFSENVLLPSVCPDEIDVSLRRFELDSTIDFSALCSSSIPALSLNACSDLVEKVPMPAQIHLPYTVHSMQISTNNCFINNDVSEIASSVSPTSQSNTISMSLGMNIVEKSTEGFSSTNSGSTKEIRTERLSARSDMNERQSGAPSLPHILPEALERTEPDGLIVPVNEANGRTWSNTSAVNGQINVTCKQYKSSAEFEEIGWEVTDEQPNAICMHNVVLKSPQSTSTLHTTSKVIEETNCMTNAANDQANDQTNVINHHYTLNVVQGLTINRIKETRSEITDTQPEAIGMGQNNFSSIINNVVNETRCNATNGQSDVTDPVINKTNARKRNRSNKNSEKANARKKARLLGQAYTGIKKDSTIDKRWMRRETAKV